MKKLFVMVFGWFLFGSSAAFGQSGPSPQPPLAQGSEEILKKIGIDQHLNAQIPLDLPFLDENGFTVTLRQYFTNKPVLIAPVYYECPMLCNMVLNGVLQCVTQLQQTPGKDFMVLVVSFDPREKPELAFGKKNAYLKRYGRPGTEDGWHFLTGKEAAIAQLMSALGFRYTWDESQKQFAHASGIMVLTPQGKISKYFYGVEYAPDEVRLGMIQASTNHIGTPAQQILLYCFHYDPSTGKYSLITLRAVKVGGVLTLLVIGTFLFVMLRRERLNQKPIEQ